MTNAIKNFEDAALDAPEEIDLSFTHGFKLGGVQYEARLPTKAEVALWTLASQNGSRAGFNETLRFLGAVLHDSTWDDEDGELLRTEDGELDGEIPAGFNPDAQMDAIEKRWRNPRDPLAPESWIPVVRWLIEERSAFPTSSSSGSTSGRPPRGTSSTASSPRKASTRKRSTSAGSAT